MLGLARKQTQDRHEPILEEAIADAAPAKPDTDPAADRMALAIAELDALRNREDFLGDDNKILVSDREEDSIHWQSAARTDSNPIIRGGFWSVCVLMGVFLVWATVFPLSSAVITPGTFVSDGRNKLIQHTNGGRVAELHVREGQILSEGDVVLRLDAKTAQAELTKLNARHASLVALQARLDAERSGGLHAMPADIVPSPASTEQAPRLRGSADRFGSGRTITIADLRHGAFDTIATGSIASDGTAAGDGAGAGLQPSDRESTGETMMQGQRTAYVSGRKLLNQELQALAQKVATLKKQRDGLVARTASQQSLLALASREYARLKPLARDGYVARNRLNDSERTMLELQGTVKALELDVIGMDTQIGEVMIDMRKLRTETATTAAREYTKILGELAEIADQRVAARAAVDGSLVRAPASGTLTNLSIATVGGVIGAADTIGEIVPKGAALLVQARVAPGDIDYVKPGQQADIAVTAFNRRMDDMLSGRVAYVAADAEKDEKTGEPYFTVRLALDTKPGDANANDRRGDVQAGMQGEVYIHTGERTFMTYLARPIVESFRRAFREQ